MVMYLSARLFIIHPPGRSIDNTHPEDLLVLHVYIHREDLLVLHLSGRPIGNTPVGKTY